MLETTTNTMAEETIKAVAENEELVFDTAEEIIENVGFDWVKFGKTVGGIAVVAGVAYGSYKLITKGIPAFKNWKSKNDNEVIDTEVEDYEEAIDEEVLAVEVEETEE